MNVARHLSSERQERLRTRARYYRQRAEEQRTIAERVVQPYDRPEYRQQVRHSRNQLKDVAACYDSYAEFYERMLGEP